MTFVPNEAGLARLLLSEQGPVGRMTTVATELVREEAIRRANEVTQQKFQFGMADVIGSDVSESPTGPRGTVGIERDGQRISELLADKAAKEQRSGTFGDFAAALEVLQPFGWTIVR